MPEYTAHLSLGKPIRDERYDIAVPNRNMDIIDETVQRLEAENQALRAELAGKVDKDSTDWTDLELINGAGTTSAVLQYRRFNGAVCIRGVATNLQEEVTFALLPESCWPHIAAHFIVSNNTGAQNTVFQKIYIRPNGELVPAALNGNDSTRIEIIYIP